MLFNIAQYTPVNVSTLANGMRIDYSIFYQKNDEYHLLCKDITLTAELITKFNRFTAPTYNIYVPNEHYDMFIETSQLLKDGTPPEQIPESVPKPKPTPQPAADYPEYAVLQNETSELLEAISEDGSIPMEVTEDIVSTVHTQIETVEISSIVQSINSVRDIDAYLHTHSTNVALLNGLMGKWLHFSNEKLQKLIKIGLLHDIGKLKIPPEILNKPGKLTKEEFEVIKKHPVHSCDMLMKSGVKDNELLLGVLQHHEKVNGQGYPRGLNMEQISEFAKITSISDVYDAMVAARVYKSAHSPFQILAWFAEGCYSDLDITFVNIFLDCMTEEFRGKTVLLSNDETGTVIYVDSKNLEYPIVQTDKGIVNTSPALYCVSLIGEY